MKNFFRTLIIAIAAVCSLSVKADEKRVLFVGNSYVYTNDLPQIISNIAQSMGDVLVYQSNCPGGCTFAQHCTNQSMSLICQGGWDAVILQEQSQYPSFPISQVMNDVYPYAERLVDSVYANNPCAEPMFFMTWGRKYGDQDNAQYYAPLGTYEGMDGLLCARYTYMAQTNDASLCPVGKVWHYLRDNNPNIELYSSDNSHPSAAGSYAAACSFYVMLFHRDPTAIPYANIDNGKASIIRHAVKAIVYDSLETYQRPKPEASFSSTLINEEDGVYAFFNNSVNANEFSWNFGDGTTSTEQQPMHIFATGGTFNVSLIASRHCMADTMTLTVNIPTDTLSVNENACNQISIYPNPTNGPVSIGLDADEIQYIKVYDASGRQLIEVQNTNVLNLGTLPKGVYCVQVSTIKGLFTSKVALN